MWKWHETIFAILKQIINLPTFHIFILQKRNKFAVNDQLKKCFLLKAWYWKLYENSEIFSRTYRVTNIKYKYTNINTKVEVF